MINLKIILKKNKVLLNIARTMRSILYVIFWLPYIIYCGVKNKRNKNIVYCECYVKTSPYSIKRNNWGDDLNKFFFEYITDKKMVFMPFSMMLNMNNRLHYSLIGSILGFYNLNNTIIYGSGVRDEKSKLIGKPRKVYSVRGPKSRKVLLENGIECPENYGDPAIMLPLFYEPPQRGTHRICVIPNMGTAITEVNDILHKMDCGESVKLVDMTQYDKWTDVIDEIVNSDLVISESLHGLIVAETYGIPNVWVEFKQHPEYWNFKFEDYYESISKYDETCFKLFEDANFENIITKASQWKKGDINYKLMLEYFPFKIDKEMIKN